MKSKLMSLFVIGALLTHSPVKATMNPTKLNSNFSEAPVNMEKAKSEVLIVRLSEIKGLDKSNMTSAEKKVLRKEVKTIKAELAKTSGGVYLSVGAILLIVLLLIVLL
jgi:type IV secretory pathway VirJ component